MNTTMTTRLAEVFDDLKTQVEEATQEAIDEAMSGLDLEKKVEDAIEEARFDRLAEDAIEEKVENVGFLRDLGQRLLDSGAFQEQLRNFMLDNLDGLLASPEFREKLTAALFEPAAAGLET